MPIYSNVECCSEECSKSKFWAKPISTTDSSPEVSGTNSNNSNKVTANIEAAVADTNYAQNHSINHCNDYIGSPTKQQISATATSMAIPESTKRYQTKMLLVSLIEFFCRSNDDSPDANRRTFFLICQTLRTLGIIDAQFMDEMASVRSAFYETFRKLFFTAVQTVHNQGLITFEDSVMPRLIIEKYSEQNQKKKKMVKNARKRDSNERNSSRVNASKQSYPEPLSDSADYFTATANSAQVSPASHSNSLSKNTSNSTKSLHYSFTSNGADFFHNLSVQNSRYNNDFVEINLLGKGGFASAYRARNKLDGIDYAVKKIRLGKNIEEGGSTTSSYEQQENPYEKIFREIKNLARLEHHNVIRYYASWLERDDDTSVAPSSTKYAKDTMAMHSYNEGDVLQKQKKTLTSPYEDSGDNRLNTLHDSSGSIFNGYDPTYDQSFGSDVSFSKSRHEEMSGMSQIQFGECSDKEENYSGDDSSSAGEPNFASSLKTSSKKLTSEVDKKPSLKSKGEWKLFIQMQLCPTTLHDYIHFRNKQHAESLRFREQTIDTQRNIEIFSQILQGTAYIHDQGLIHRDLKPSNIFLSMSHDSNNSINNRRRRVSSAGGCLESPSNSSLSSHYFGPKSYDHVVSENGLRECMWDETWVPKIGDFGLAAEAMDYEGTGDSVLVPTPISSTPPSPVLASFTSSYTSSSTTTNTNTTDESNNYNSSDPITINKRKEETKPKRPTPKRTRTVGVGTCTYASPEQLAIPSIAYDEKVDIYSLGIILFELFQPFSTGMERAQSLDNLKHGMFPGDFLELYPKISTLVIWMMDTCPDRRPTAHQLLEFELFVQPQDVNSYLTLQTLQTQLQSKTVSIEFKNKEIEELKKKMERIELEKQQTVDGMQQKIDALQAQLQEIQQSSPRSPPPQKRQIALKKKKEVRWSSFDCQCK